MTQPAKLSHKLLAHGSIYAATRVATQALGFILVPIYARRLKEDGYGVIALLGSLSPFLSILFAQGLLSAWFRLRHDYPGDTERRVFETTIIWYLVPSGIVLVTLITLLGGPFAALLGRELSFFPLVFLTVVTAALQVYTDLFLRQAQSEQQPMRVMAFSLPRTLLTLVAIVAGVVWLDLGPLGKVGAEALSALVFGVLALRLIRPGPFSLVSREVLKRGLSYGLPLVPHTLTMQINAVATRILLTRQLGLSATGVYSMGAAIIQVGNVIVMSLNQGFSPLFIAELKRLEKLAPDDSKREAAQQGIVRAGLMMLALSATVALALTAGARELLMILTTPAFAESHRVAALLGAGMVARAGYLVFSQPLFYTASTARRMPLVSVVGAAVNIGGCLWLLPRLGMLGAAVAACASSVVMAGHSLWLARHVLPLPYRPRQWLGVFAVAGGALCGLFFIDDQVAQWLPRVGAKAALGLLAVALIARAAEASPAALWRALRR